MTYTLRSYQKEAKDAAIVTGDTTKKERERVTHGFRAGHIKTVCNVGVLTTGFDFPELDTVLKGGSAHGNTTKLGSY